MTWTRPDPKQLHADTLAYIRAHPEDWNQSDWRCETGMCYAGTAVMLAGGTFPFAAAARSGVVDLVDPPNGPRTNISEWAAWLFDLDEGTAEDTLFYTDNTLDDLTHIVARINAGLPLTHPDGEPLAVGAEWADLPDAPVIIVFDKSSPHDVQTEPA